ncbi:hypothetical protein [Pseudomonas sp. PS02290]|uniref:hypothetical protein n=1 Tax=Pseudomonas sp. PS02290 TaxID=2991430 RepID=UPI00249AA34E|nr:hypothetical protein [Pseudomonas sp. PS02290]
MKPTWKLISTVTAVALSLSLCQVHADPHSDGLELGKNNLNKLSSKVSNSNAQTMPHYTNKPPQSQNFGSSDLFGVGVSRINTCKTEAHGPDQIANQECDAVNFLAKNPEQRVKFPLDPKDPIISGIGETINNANGGSATEACGTKTTTTPDIYSTEVCNEYNLSEMKSCSMGQVVNVDAKANFQCNITKNRLEQVSCDAWLTVACQPPVAGCSGGGIKTGSASLSNGSYTYKLVGDDLTIINDVTAINNITSADFNFTIEGLDRVTDFFINSIHSDNYVGVSVNGHFVGVHARIFSGWNPSADRLVQDFNYSPPHARWGPNPGDHYQAEIGGNLLTAVNADLKPYLREGQNVITVNVLNGKGPGYGKVYITAHQLCPPPCVETWTNQCESYQQRL